MSIFAKFNNQIDKEQLSKDIAAAEENQQGDFEVPEGLYAVEIEKIELKESKNNFPMVSIWFNILDGKCKGCKLFFNQVVQFGTKNQGFQMRIIYELIESLGTGIELIDRTDLIKFEEWVNAVSENVDGIEYDLKYWKDKKGYANYKIEEIYIG